MSDNHDARRKVLVLLTVSEDSVYARCYIRNGVAEEPVGGRVLKLCHPGSKKRRKAS